MKPLKRIFIFTGLTQAFILIAAYALLYIYPNDLLLTILFAYSLFLGFFVIKQRSTVLLINNTAIIFMLFLVLYGIFNALILMFLNGELPREVYVATLIYALTVPAFIISWSVKKPIRYDLVYEDQVRTKKLHTGYNLLLIIFLLALIVYKSYFFISMGMFFNPAALVGGERFDLLEGVGQIDIVTGFLISAIFIYFIFYFKKLSRIVVFLLSALLLYYILLQLNAGNRKDFMPMVLGAFWVYINIKKIKFNVFGFIGILLFVLLFNYLGTLRSNMFSDAGKTDDVLTTMTSNEFVYPFFTLSFEVDDYLKTNSYEFKNGVSYLFNPILVFIPREIYSDKPISLANEFIKKFYGNRANFGFAYTPVSEAFVNFGIVGPFFMYIIFGFAVSYLQRNRNQILNFIFFTMILDFARGEVATFMYQFFFTSLFLFILPKIAQMLFLKKRTPIPRIAAET